MSSPKSSTKRKWFNWHHLYYFLATFNVLTISTSLFLNHTVLEIYSESFRENSVWSNRVSRYSRLNELAAAVNAPGNDAFDSGDIAGERHRLVESYQIFQHATAAARDDLERNDGTDSSLELLRQLGQIDGQVALIHKHATAVFAELENNKQQAAGSRMAEMDRCFSRSLKLIGTLCETVRQIQSTRFDVEIARAEQLGRFEFGITGVVCLILCVVTCYGHKVAEYMNRNEEQIRISERQVKAIVHSSVDPIITMSGRGLIKSFNPAAERMFGYSETEVLEKNVSLLMPLPFREEHDGYLAHYLTTGKKNIIGIGREVVGLRKNGTTVPIYLSVSEVVLKDVYDALDKDFLFTGIIRDLTEQKQREEEAERHTRELQIAAENNFEGQIAAISKSQMVIEFEIDGTIIKANDKFLNTMGYTLEEVTGQHHSMFVEPALRQSDEYRTFWDKLNQGEYVSAELKHIGKDGKEVWVQASYNPILDLNGKPSKVVKYSVDVTDRVLIGLALETTKNDLAEQTAYANSLAAKSDAANQAKSEFLANMSHEIRTPMTAILGFTDLILDSADNPQHVEAAETIKLNGKHLLGIINDILDLSRIEAGKLDLERTDASPCGIITEVASLMRVRADAKGLSLKAEFTGPIPETITTDPTRLRQILINLVGNAVKFTEVGEIRIVASLVENTESDPKLQIEIIDTGIGITEQQMAQLFTPFSQADTSASRKFGGSGLGLAISKRLAAGLGGEITMSSVVAGGSTFTLTVATGPLDDVRLLENPSEAELRAEPSQQPVESNQTRLDCRLLLVEDGPDNQRLIAFLLKKAGAEVSVAGNGQIAVKEVLAAREEGRPFDVILMDMQMPVMDGYDATRKLRTEGYTGPIIALTAHAMVGDRQKCLDAGCDDYMTKPVDRNKLVAIVAKHTRKEQAHASS